MKLRLKGNSLRLRVVQSELARLARGERLEETIYFGPGAEAKLTYVLEPRKNATAPQVEYSPGEVIAVLPSAQVETWAATEQVGVYASCEIGRSEPLELIVEKDFACLDLSDAENVDTFPNPIQGTAC